MAVIDVRIPGNAEAERALLGSLMTLRSNKLGMTIDTLCEDDFLEPHNHIFKAMQVLYRRCGTCSDYAIKQEMERAGTYQHLPDEWYLERDCKGSMHAFVPLEELTETVKSEARYRRLYAASATIAHMALTRDENALEEAEKLITSIALGTARNPVSSLQDMMVKYLKVLDDRRDKYERNIAIGVPTGFVDLDRLTGGLQPPDVIILAARTSVGKTAFALNVGLNIVQHSRHVLFFSLEMNKDSLSQRLIAMDAPLDQTSLRDGSVDDSEYGQAVEAMGRLSSLHMDVDDQSRGIAEIKSVARKIHATDPLNLVVIDYLQLMRSATDDVRKSSTRAEEVGTITRALKELAMELNIPILVLAQLNRKIEDRSQKTPQLSDLRESGNIEMDADVVIFLSVEEEEIAKRKERLPYRVSVSVSKQRNGPVGDIDLIFKPRSTRYENKQDYIDELLERDSEYQQEEQ
ncbi:MAG TPA: replicative DNA helicase [Ktedonobacteraceae bacterium]